MKAKAGFLMLLILLISFTGFGNTTADLTENSTAEMFEPGADLVSVNVVTADFAVVVLLDEAGSEDSFGSFSEKADEAISFISPTQCEAKLINPTNEDFKVGWQYNGNENYTTPPLDSNLRNPRDGIRC